MSESVTAHYGDAPDDFVLADNVELPWPSAQGDMEWSGEWYPLKTSSRGSCWPSVCGIRMWGQKKTSGGGEGGIQTPSLGQTAFSKGTGRSKEMASLPGGVVVRADERVPPQAGAQGSRVSLWPLRLSRGARGPSVKVSTRGERTSSTSMLSPPPPLSAGTSSIRWLRIGAHRTGVVTSVLGKRKAAGPAKLVGAAARAAVSRRVGGGSVDSGAPAER